MTYSSIMMKLLGGVFVLIVVVALNAGCSPASPSSTRPVSVRSSSEFDDFPLWKDVPGRTFAKLDEGKLPNGTRWAAYVSRVGAGKRGRENPCVSIARITAFGQYGHANECGPLAPLKEGWPPVMPMFGGTSYVNGREESETFTAMSFKPFIASILITTTNGDAIRKRTHLLNRYQQRKTHLPPLRYVALGLQRELCIANFVGYSSDGAIAFEAPFKECEPTFSASK